MTTYRTLTKEETAQLKKQGCLAEDWKQIYIKDENSIRYISDAIFSGEVRIGRLGKTFTDGGMMQRSSIRHARIHNCIIGDNVTIYNVNNFIANYRIEDNCLIGNVNQMNVTGRTSFGNGTEVAVLNETGGREVPIFDRLSAHLAYVTALYRYKPQLIGKIKSLIQAYTESVSSDMGTIGKDSHITNCNRITDVRCGEHTTIDGAELLLDGTIQSNAEAPTTIGDAVIAKHFICCSGSTVDDGAVIIRTFVGQATHIGQLFSSHDSLFFANCQALNGEACAIFAGPYTVTAHKSSLLISGMFSFLNAGSGSNQSNHMYKLGPIHQGVVERGSKTTSDSYVLWPAKIGAFSLVMGRHVSNTDSSRLPFSYLIEDKNKTYIHPGANLKSVGTIRDSQKWPKRDRRTDSRQLDYINFNLLSPYTTGKMLDGIQLLNDLMKQCGETSERYTYRNSFIKNSSARKGIELYTMAIDKFFGNSIIKKLEGGDFKDLEDLRSRLKKTDERGSGPWIDLAGLIAPKETIEKMLQTVENYDETAIAGNYGRILEDLQRQFRELHEKYYQIEWTWAYDQLQNWYNVDLETITPEAIIGIIDRWTYSVLSIDRMLYEDAKKEFSLISKTGFGIDGSSEKDFIEVRGSFEENPFVKMVLEHMKTKKALGEELKERLGRLESLLKA